MAEKQRLIALNRGYNGFFCPESRFHLVGGKKPQDYYPAALPLSEAVIRGLKGGSLIDVLGTCQEELGRKAPVQAAQVVQAQPAAPAAPVAPVAPVAPPANSIIDDDNDDGGDEGGKTKPDRNEFALKTYLTADEIEDAKLKDLQAFIESNQIPLDELGLNSRSKLADIQAALKKHFGH